MRVRRFSCAYGPNGSNGSLSLLGFSSLSLKPPAFSNGAKKFHGVGLIRASVAVEQQVEKTKVALVRIGTRGR